jgi:hypothetical protein
MEGHKNQPVWNTVLLFHVSYDSTFLTQVQRDLTQCGTYATYFHVLRDAGAHSQHQVTKKPSDASFFDYCVWSRANV